MNVTKIIEIMRPVLHCFPSYILQTICRPVKYIIPSTDVIQLTLTLKMTTAQVVETLVTVNNNSPIQDYVHPDGQTQPTFIIMLLIGLCAMLDSLPDPRVSVGLQREFRSEIVL